MFIYILLMLHSLIMSNCFVLKDKHNEDDNKLNKKRDSFPDKVDYEMINKEQLIQFHDDRVINKCSKADSSKNELTPSHTLAPGIDGNMIVKTTYVSSIELEESFSDENLYNYDELVQEYYEHSLAEAKTSYHVKRADTFGQGSVRLVRKALFLNALSNNCTGGEASGIGLRAVKCIIDEYKYSQRTTKEALYGLWRIVKIWFLIYAVFAVPLWLTRGLFCCCLFCKFFKPHQTIQEAKSYLLSNPPGIFKDQSVTTRYVPSEIEKEKYEEFEHLLRSI